MHNRRLRKGLSTCYSSKRGRNRYYARKCAINESCGKIFGRNADNLDDHPSHFPNLIAEPQLRSPIYQPHISRMTTTSTLKNCHGIGGKTKLMHKNYQAWICSCQKQPPSPHPACMSWLVTPQRPLHVYCQHDEPTSAVMT